MQCGLQLEVLLASLLSHDGVGIQQYFMEAMGRVDVLQRNLDDDTSWHN